MSICCRYRTSDLDPVPVLSYRLSSIGTVVPLGLDPGWCRLYGTLCTSTTHEHIDSSKSLDLRFGNVIRTEVTTILMP